MINRSDYANEKDPVVKAMNDARPPALGSLVNARIVEVGRY